MTADDLKKWRTAADIPRHKAAELLGYSANYIYLLESGRKPITPEIERRVRKLIDQATSPIPNQPNPPPNPSACHYPDGCDLSGQLAEVREELAEMRGEMAGMRSEMRIQMETLLGLLGEPLRAAYQRHQEDRGRAG